MNALNAAVRRVDAEWSSRSYASKSSTAVQAAPRPALTPATNRKRLSADEPTPTARVHLTKPVTVAANAIKILGAVMLGITSLAAVALLPVVYILGATWVSAHVVGYLGLPVSAALILCVFIFLPLALFRKTRFVSVYGFLISSYLFGFATWVLGFLTTLQYWGAIGVFIGLFLGLVGIVPLGIVASAIHTDWSSVVVLMVGLVVTYGARMLGFGLAASLER